MFTAIWVAGSQGWHRVWFQKRKAFGPADPLIESGSRWPFLAMPSASHGEYWRGKRTILERWKPEAITHWQSIV